MSKTGSQRCHGDGQASSGCSRSLRVSWRSPRMTRGQRLGVSPEWMAAEWDRNLDLLRVKFLIWATLVSLTFAVSIPAMAEDNQLAEARVLNQEAGALYQQGHYAATEPLYKRVLAIRKKALGPDHPDFATSLNDLGVLYRVQSRYAEAEPLYRRALAIREKELGPDHLDVATTLNNLATH